jgi:serine O-acetyltransferase
MPEAWTRFCADLSRYLPPGRRRVRDRLEALLRNEPLWAIGVYRLGQYLREEAPVWLRRISRAPYAVLHKAVEWGLGIHLFPETQIGPGLYLGHYGGVWISPHARLGSGCAVNHEATVGLAGRTGPGPSIGDRVWIGPNSTITGPVNIASGAVIGANSLVVGNVDENGVAVGVPAKVISHQGSGPLLDVFPAPPPVAKLHAPPEPARPAAEGTAPTVTAS